MRVDFSVIGGTGVYNPKKMNLLEEKEVVTPYGVAILKICELNSRKVAFLARHGGHHSLAPHLINYRANIFALKKLGVKKIIATAAVGSLREDLRPGDFVLLDQFLDFTKNRKNTFFEGEEGVLHVDMTEPYCNNLRKEILSILDVEIENKATYVCTEGPRFETPAEIKMFSLLGGDVVGMTSVPESVLARELGMCYASIATVTNFAAGISGEKLTHGEVAQVMRGNSERLQEMIFSLLKNLDSKRECSCSLASKELGSLGGDK